MKTPLLVFFVGLLLVGPTLAEPRAFTNKDGKTITADLIAVADGVAVLKLANGKPVKVPMDSLSEADQKFATDWWEENKNNVTEMDVRLAIEKKSDRVSSPDRGNDKGKGGDKKKVTIDKVGYSCILKSYTPRDLSNITAEYTVYKRVSTRGKEGSGTTTEEITGSATVASLPSNQSATFETTAVVCEDSSQKASKDTPASSKRETVIGVVVNLSANGKEFIQQSYPESFLDRLKEEEERNAAK